MTADEILELICSSMAAEIEGPLVTRNALDFVQYPPDQRRAGVITLILDGGANLKAPRAVADCAGTLKLWALYEFELPESSTGLQVEQKELAMWELIKAFIAAPGAGLCPLDAISFRNSGQVSAPLGWLAVQLEYAELELG